MTNDLTHELNFELNLSHDELVKRTSKDCLIPKEMLKEDAKEYEALADGDKKALVHLVKAAKAIDEVFMKQDNPKNLAFKAYLEREVNNGQRRCQNDSCSFQCPDRYECCRFRG